MESLFWWLKILERLLPRRYLTEFIDDFFTYFKPKQNKNDIFRRVWIILTASWGRNCNFCNKRWCRLFVIIGLVRLVKELDNLSWCTQQILTLIISMVEFNEVSFAQMRYFAYANLRICVVVRVKLFLRFFSSTIAISQINLLKSLLKSVRWLFNLWMFLFWLLWLLFLIYNAISTKSLRNRCIIWHSHCSFEQKLFFSSGGVAFILRTTATRCVIDTSFLFGHRSWWWHGIASSIHWHLNRLHFEKGGVTSNYLAWFMPMRMKRRLSLKHD